MDHLDLADDVGVEFVQFLGWNPELEDRLSTALWTGYRLKYLDSISKRMTKPAPECFTFQSRAILAA